jgi:uncharacterized membrane protein YdjX (TVP38/TMEM64 family)
VAQLASEYEASGKPGQAGRPGAILGAVLRFGPAFLLLAGLAAALGSGALNHLSLQELRASRYDLHAFVEAHPFQAVGAYFGLYVAVISLSLPAALVMTLTGGFLFGPWLGGLVADLGCSVGAVVVFAACRLAAGDSLERRANPRIRAFEEGFRKDSFFYLLTLRLVPVTPSWLVNLAAGLIGLPPRQYVAATVLGFLPSSFIYAGLGSGLDRIFDRGAHLGPQLFLAPRIVVPLIGLAALSVLPILHHWLRARRRAAVTGAPMGGTCED